MFQPDLAFIVPARNAARTLPMTLECALAQEGVRVEVVVIDDGSTDDTLAIARGVAERDRRVSVLTSERCTGVATARNRGIAASRAPYLCFLDADDLVPPQKADRQLSFLSKSPEFGVVYSPANEFRDDDVDASVMVQMALGDEALRESLLTGGVAFPPHCAIVRRDWVERVHGFDEAHFHEIEDTFLWTRLALAGCRFAHLEMQPVLYRRHSGAKSANRVMVLNARIELATWLEMRTDVADVHRRRMLMSRRRYLTLILAGQLAREGSTGLARRRVLGLIWSSRRPGEVLEVLRFLVSPPRPE